MSNSYKVMGDFLQKHAYQNVWCTPNQDKQTIFKPARITKEGGTWNTVAVMWRTHKLPDPVARFHVYQIGQIHPTLLGLLAKKGAWLSVADVCKSLSLIADLYTDTGVQIHRTQTWYMVTPDNNLIIAVKLPNKKRVAINLDVEDLYVRLYTNAFYNSLRADNADDVIHVEGRMVNFVQDVLDVQQSLAYWNSRGYGHCYCFINGMRVSTISLVTAKIGDLVEFVYDGSIKRVVSFPISALEQFTSTLDNAQKYLLHHSEPSQLIDYVDDVDVFLVKPATNNTFSGVYYHKNNETALRMVTHKDYSIPVAYLAAYAQLRPELGGVVDDLVVELHIRDSGYERPLVLEAQRISELYQLSDSDVVRAMVGVDSTVSVWNAAALEHSGYTALMRANLGEVSREMVQNAYGYHAVSKLLGDTPLHAREMGGAYFVDVPVGLQDCSTAYEYDADGHLIAWYTHTSGAVYACRHAETRLVEIIFGLASEGFQSFWGAQTLTVEPEFNYRYYTCGKTGPLIDDQWVDRTGSDHYSVNNNTVTWLTNASNTYPMVRGNKRHIVYKLNYFSADSLYRFSLREWRADLNAYRVMSVPPGKIDIFLNKRSLIENLHYFVDFPLVTIVDKEFLDDPLNKAQEIVVRMSGFCTSELKHEQVSDVGFVQYGVLSKNNRYDVRHDKVSRIIVDGALYRYDEFEYAETDFDVRVTDARNGAPYAISDIVVPMNDFLHTDDAKVDPTYTLRAQAKAVDTEISDYLTLKLPEKDPTLPSAIPERNKIVSPFFSKIINDLQTGILWEQKFTEHYSDEYVQSVCEPYEYLLNHDPIKEGLTPDKNFVVIHPHILMNYIEMEIYQFKFLSRVVSIYGQGKIELSSHVKLGLFGE